MKSIAIKIGALLLLGFLGLNILAWNHARSMMTFEPDGVRTKNPLELSPGGKLKALLFGVTIPRPQEEKLLGRWRTHGEELMIGGADDVSLAACYVNEGAETPLVIFFHGYSTGKNSLLMEANLLMKQGVSVMVVDFRGSGGSSEAYTTLGVDEARDVASVVKYVESELSHSSVILYGFSMGAVAILKAIQEDGIEPDGIVLAAVFDRMLNTVEHRFNAMGVSAFPSAQLLVLWAGVQQGFNGFAHNPEQYAVAVKCPVLFLHGENDPWTKVEDGRRVCNAVPIPTKKFVVFDGLGHESYARARPDQWRQEVMTFLGNSDVEGGRLFIAPPLKSFGLK